MNKKIIKEIIDKLMRYNTIVLTSHTKPDGDAISSSYGLSLALLKAFPKKKILVVGDPKKIEKQFTFLKLRKELFISPTSKISGHYIAIVGDTSVSSRINGYDIIKKANTKICFDHHDSKPDITYDIFWSEPTYYASSLQAIQIANVLLKKLNHEIAFCLVIGVYTDTNNFRYSLADTMPMKLAMSCLKYIDDRTMDIFFNKLTVRTKDSIDIMKFAFKKIKYSGNFAYVIFTEKQLTKYPDHINVGKLVNMISNIENINKWCFFTQTRDSDNQKIYRAHLRSNGPSLIKIVSKYNGGGHHRAAGCQLTSKADLNNIIKELSK